MPLSQIQLIQIKLYGGAGTWTKILSFLQIVGCSVHVISLIEILSLLAWHHKIEESFSYTILVFVAILILCVGNIVGFLLFVGAEKENTGLLIFWIAYAVISCIWSFFLISTDSSTVESILRIVMTFCAYLFGILVVNTLLEDIRMARGASAF